jgi:hypothetical protein
MLVWHEVPDAQAVLIHSAIETEEILAVSGPVLARQGDLHPVWSSTVAGVVLAPTMPPRPWRTYCRAGGSGRSTGSLRESDNRMEHPPRCA